MELTVRLMDSHALEENASITLLSLTLLVPMMLDAKLDSIAHNLLENVLPSSILVEPVLLVRIPLFPTVNVDTWATALTTDACLCSLNPLDMSSQSTKRWITFALLDTLPPLKDKLEYSPANLLPQMLTIPPKDSQMTQQKMLANLLDQLLPSLLNADTTKMLTSTAPGNSEMPSLDSLLSFKLFERSSLSPTPTATLLLKDSGLVLLSSENGNYSLHLCLTRLGKLWEESRN
jgi:hypothetical protein